jgi:DNA recombination protein RmuC
MVVDKLAKNLSTAAKSVEMLGTRTRAMNRKLRDVESVTGEAADNLLELNTVSHLIGAQAAEMDEAED